MEHWLRQLVLQGMPTGTLTLADVSAVVPETLEINQLEQLLDALEREGVRVIDPDEPLPVPEPAAFVLPKVTRGDSM